MEKYRKTTRKNTHGRNRGNLADASTIAQPSWLGDGCRGAARQTVAGRANPSLSQNPPVSSVLVLGVPGLVTVGMVAVMMVIWIGCRFFPFLQEAWLMRIVPFAMVPGTSHCH